MTPQSSTIPKISTPGTIHFPRLNKIFTYFRRWDFILYIKENVQYLLTMHSFILVHLIYWIKKCSCYYSHSGVDQLVFVYNKLKPFTNFQIILNNHTNLEVYSPIAKLFRRKLVHSNVDLQFPFLKLLALLVSLNRFRSNSTRYKMPKSPKKAQFVFNLLVRESCYYEFDLMHSSNQQLDVRKFSRRCWFTVSSLHPSLLFQATSRYKSPGAF